MDDSALRDKILTAVGMGALPEDEKDQALADVIVVLNSRVVERIRDQLSEAQLEEINAINEREASDQEQAQWFQVNVPNYAQILEEEAEAMHQENSDMVNQAMSAGDAPGLPSNGS